ncbi:MAG: flagellar biosynthetic protein FliR [Candidatus Scalindua rubra]|uniref:Flagellar biosynthetic protein FliR n=1 Tax=Candidatus Scalindua brodae TaxID=237368 RepID=A0A0B0EQU2_9BACT|nr:MAG: flagellar biosynthetic protein FliR [Candidatus Scalindua brodae]MBZ0107216.1 flagellar biosynthetic protein FliR [Candidatus Scalindua rubra]TWU31655.1 Flagellar biosynthetic protein FliR [Candidatus Brocadiaceae bacterium S225]
MILDSINLLPMFAIVLIRTASVLFFSPIYNQAGLPLIVKIGLALVIAFAIFPTINSSQPALPDNLINFILIVFKELAIGFLIGYVATLAFAAFVMGGGLISSEMGLTMAELVDPLSGEQVSPIAQLLQIVALILFFAINGHHWLINALVLSYKAVPITGVIELGFSMGKIMNLFNGLFVAAIKIAAPIMIVLGLTVVVSGFLARSTPEINIFLIIFPMKILVGFLLLAIMFPFITRAIEYLLEMLRKDIFSLVGGM